MSDLSRIGFIGLGIMGAPMARRIYNAGYSLSVYNRTKHKMDEFARLGVHPCEGYNELANRSEVIITMLPDSSEVVEVILGTTGLFSHLNSGTVIIDMSSIAPLVSRDIAKKLKQKEVEFLDAPVSGGETGAIEGALAIMVGGSEPVFEKQRSLLQTMGEHIVHVGPVGSGGFTKLSNQIIVALNIAALGESLTLAQKAGLDVEKVYSAIRGGLAGSKVLDAKFPSIIGRTFEPGFKLKLHQKDLKNTLETAQNLNIQLPLTKMVYEFIGSLCADGKAELDHSVLIQYFEKISGVVYEKKME